MDAAPEPAPALGRHVDAPEPAPALRRQVELSLDAALVEALAPYAPDLGVTVERLLFAFLSKRRRDDPERERRLDAAIADLNRVIERHGSLADDYSSRL